MTKNLFDKFFHIRNPIKGPTVVLSQGNMIGKVMLIPTQKNTLVKTDYQYVGIYDNDYIGTERFMFNFPDLIKYTGIPPYEFYYHIKLYYYNRYL